MKSEQVSVGWTLKEKQGILPPNCMSQIKVPYLYFRSNFSTTERITGVLSTTSLKGDRVFVYTLSLFESKEIMKYGTETWRSQYLQGRANCWEHMNIPFKGGLWTNRRFSSSWITASSGGSLSLKHIVETRSMKKLLQNLRNWVFFSMQILWRKCTSHYISGQLRNLHHKAHV